MVREEGMVYLTEIKKNWLITLAEILHQLRISRKGDPNRKHNQINNMYFFVSDTCKNYSSSYYLKLFGKNQVKKKQTTKVNTSSSRYIALNSSCHSRTSQNLFW